MTSLRFGLLPVLLLVAWPAAAGVYRCDRDGRPYYTDQPCNKTATPAPLPPLVELPRSRQDADLAKQYDTEARHEAQANKKARIESAERAQQAETQAAEIRRALIDGRVVKGMTRNEVERVLNLPNRIEDEGSDHERWFYQDGRSRRTITFEKGVVSSDKSRTSRK